MFINIYLSGLFIVVIKLFFMEKVRFQDDQNFMRLIKYVDNQLKIIYKVLF